jgi:uncharacterized protein
MDGGERMNDASQPAAILNLERPSPALLKYYAIFSLVAGPLYPLLFIPALIRYWTLRYRFDDEGVSMRWGVLFRREVIVNYARIQDIHLTSNVLERWLNLARIQIQTASGSASAEMTIEGLHEFEAIRDFLYSKMRGLKEGRTASTGAIQAAGTSLSGKELEELAATLRELAAELRATREALERRPPPAA